MAFLPIAANDTVPSVVNCIDQVVPLASRTRPIYQSDESGRKVAQAAELAGAGRPLRISTTIAEAAQDRRGDRFHQQVAGKLNQHEKAGFKGVVTEAKLEHQGHQG
jgi:hypothetical protein